LAQNVAQEGKGDASWLREHVATCVKGREFF
jgi:hypothetical protein